MTALDRGQRVHFAAELRQIAKDVEAGTVSLEHAASLLLVVSVRMETAKEPRTPPRFIVHPLRKLGCGVCSACHVNQPCMDPP